MDVASYSEARRSVRTHSRQPTGAAANIRAANLDRRYDFDLSPGQVCSLLDEAVIRDGSLLRSACRRFPARIAARAREPILPTDQVGIGEFGRPCGCRLFR